MKIENAISLVTAGLKYKTRPLPPTSIVIHRCGVGYSARDIHLAYRDRSKYAAGSYTGGLFPYHFLIPSSGTIEQCLPISYNAPAALSSLNKTGIHIALVGDMRKEPATHEQEVALVGLCHLLQRAYNWKLDMRGHTDTAGSSSDPAKECPGKHFDLAHLKETLDDERVLTLSPEIVLNMAGIIL